MVATQNIELSRIEQGELVNAKHLDPLVVSWQDGYGVSPAIQNTGFPLRQVDSRAKILLSKMNWLSMSPENLHKYLSNLHALVESAWWEDQKFLTIFSV